MFLSIFAATCRPNNIAPFLDNLTTTCDDPSSFEVLIKLDEGADELIEIIENYKKTSKICIKYLATSRLDGYYTLDVGYNELLKIADPDSYFCWLLTDEIRFETKGWDTILKKYIGLYPDDIFRLKLSIFAMKNYYDFFECLPCPDNYAVTTRKWLEITGGWGNFWGPDSWHQCVDYYLGLCKNEDNPYGVWRSYPVLDIKVEGQEAGQGIEDPEKLQERIKKIWLGWAKYSTHAAQENFKLLAVRLNAHILAHSRNLGKYIIEENVVHKYVILYNVDKTVCYSREFYNLPKLRIRFIVGQKKLRLVHIFSFLAYNRTKIVKKFHRFNGIKHKTKANYQKFKTHISDFIDGYVHHKLNILANISTKLLQMPAKIASSVYRNTIGRICKLPTAFTNAIKVTLNLPHTILKYAFHGLTGMLKICREILTTEASISCIKTLIRKYIGLATFTASHHTYIYDGTKLIKMENK